MRALFQTLGLGFAWQRGHLAEWLPICLAIGIGGYFSLTFEPAARDWLWLAAIVAVVAVGGRFLHENWRPLATALVLIAGGAALAGFRAHQVAEPVIPFRYYGPIEGRIVKVDRSASDAVRLMLDQVVLKRMAREETPARVRVSLHGRQGFIDPVPGMRIILTGHLSQPSGPVEPGGFDFQRQAWFQRLGAVGYTRTPVLTLEPPGQVGFGIYINQIRSRIAEHVRNQIAGDPGAFAVAITTGDRSWMSPDVLEDLRASNLAHLLAISGLHMGLVTGLLFAAMRLALALVPQVALRWPTKQIAAAVALIGGAGYLALSGGNVATVRAFVMATVVLVAVILGRRALTLRAVAVAATFILVWTPEALFGPGFQMSFAATTALVAAFGALNGSKLHHAPRWARPVVALVISSAVAGGATAPVAAAHFNRFADYGLLANLLSVSVMGLVVMPGAILAAVLAPIGLEGIGFAIMTPGIRWIIWVADMVAGMEGAQSYVASPPGWVLPAIAGGMLWLILWQARPHWRLAGLALPLVAFWGWAGAERPAILISDTGGLVGVMGEAGRVLSKPRGEGFAAESWLENDGELPDQAQAALRKGFVGTRGEKLYELEGKVLVHLTGRGSVERAADWCGKAEVIVLSGVVSRDTAPCEVIDRGLLSRRGSLSVRLSDGGPRLTGSRDVTGERLWNSRAARLQWARGPAWAE